jgi:hypothetical protein
MVAPSVGKKVGEGMGATVGGVEIVGNMETYCVGGKLEVGAGLGWTVEVGLKVGLGIGNSVCAYKLIEFKPTVPP